MGGFLARTAEKKPCAVRTACCGLSFIVCSGPLLILIAVVLYFIPYQAVRFTPKVYEYNVQVAQFLTRLNFIQSTSFEISTTFIYDKLTLASRLPPIEGDRIGIANQPSLIHAGSTGTFFALASGNYNVRARTTAGTEKQRISVPTSNNQTFQVVCTWASPCTDINQDFCPEGYNSYSGSNVCEKDTTCGTCSGRLYVLQMCIQVENTLPLSFPLTRQGCAYPFGGRFGDYSSPTPLKEISVQFMSQDDPYVHLQLITKGTNDFGVSYETLEILKDIAVAMFGIGCLIVVITILILALVFFRQENRRNLMLIYGRVLGVKDVVEYRDNQYAVPEKQFVHSTMPQQMGNGMMQPQQQMGNGMISRQPSMGNGMMQPQQQMGNGMRPSGTMNVAPNGMMQPQQQMGNGMRPSGTMNLPGNGADQRQPSMGNSLQRPGMENQTFGTMRPVAPLTTNPMDAFHTPMKLH